MKKAKHGGKRPGAGRKPLDVPTVRINLFLSPEVYRIVKANGGSGYIARLVIKDQEG